MAGQFVNWFASFAVLFLILYLTGRGMSLARAGGVVAAYGFGGLISGVVAGHFADRVGRRTTMAVAMVGSAVFTLGLYFIRAYPALLPTAFLAGLATDGWRPAARALMADLVPEGARVSAFALSRFIGHIGFGAGGVLAGFLADQSFLWVFLLDAATSLAFALLIVTVLPEGRVTGREEEHAAGGGYRRILADRSFLLLLGASTLMSFVYFQQQGATLPVHVVRVSGLQPSDFGLLLGFNALMVALLELPLSSLTMRRPPREMLALGFGLIGVGFGLTAFSHSLWTLLGTVAVWSLGEMIAAPVAFAYVADIAPEHLRARYQGLYGVFFESGTVTGPAIGTALFAWNPTGFWLLCGALGILSGLLVLVTRAAAGETRAAAAPAARTIGAGGTEQASVAAQS
jgi:MFS family permease